MIHYHGTCADHFADIVKNGLFPSKQIWTPSEDDTTYFWSPYDLADADKEPYEEDPERWHQDAFSRAADSAIFTLPEARDCRRIIVAVNLTATDEVTPDESCANMEGAVSVRGRISPDKIAAIYMDGSDLSIAKGAFIAWRDDCKLAIKPELSPLEKAVAKRLKDCDLTDLLSEMNWEMKKIYHNHKKFPKLPVERGAITL